MAHNVWTLHRENATTGLVFTLHHVSETEIRTFVYNTARELLDQGVGEAGLTAARVTAALMAGKGYTVGRYTFRVSGGAS